jgi:hypothetical protein
MKRYIYLVKTYRYGVSNFSCIGQSVETSKKAAVDRFWRNVASLVNRGYKQTKYIPSSSVGDRIWIGYKGDNERYEVVIEQYNMSEFASVIGNYSEAADLILDNRHKWTKEWVKWAEYWQGYSPDDDQPLRRWL